MFPVEQIFPFDAYDAAANHICLVFVAVGFIVLLKIMEAVRRFNLRETIRGKFK